ncbi:hypothetical protein TNCV_4198721 [Trichonephila clavipes]|nr:hypothetical protein TNCV_4198721 [Trichonephila clavipes]
MKSHAGQGKLNHCSKIIFQHPVIHSFSHHSEDFNQFSSASISKGYNKSWVHSTRESTEDKWSGRNLRPSFIKYEVSSRKIVSLHTLTAKTGIGRMPIVTGMQMARPTSTKYSCIPRTEIEWEAVK